MLNEMTERMDTVETTEDLETRIAERIRRYVGPDTVGSVCTAVLRGQVVRVDGEVPLGAGIIALRHGILFVPDGEYRVGEE